MTVALVPRIIIMAPGSRPTYGKSPSGPSKPGWPTLGLRLPTLDSRSHTTMNTRADIDLLQQALEFAAECEADIKPEDRKRMEKKILE